MEGDFMNCTLGDFEMSANHMTAGWIVDGQLEAAIEWLVAEAGRPLVRIGKAPTDINVSVKASLREVLRLELWALALGIDEAAIEDIEGSENTDYWKEISEWEVEEPYSLGAYAEPTVLNGYCYEATAGGTSGAAEPEWPTTIGETVVDGTVTWTCRAYGGEEKTFASLEGGDIEAIQVSGYNLDETDVPAVYNSDFTEKYVASDDYIVDSKRGVVIANPGGSISSEDTVNVIYKYTEINTQRLNFKPEDFVLKYVPVKLQHTKAVDGEDIEFMCFNMKSKETSVVFAAKNWSEHKLNLLAFYDSERPNYPYGRITWKNLN